MADLAEQKWKSGASLSEAVEKFSPQDMWDQYSELDAAAVPDKITGRRRQPEMLLKLPIPAGEVRPSYFIESTLQSMRRDLEAAVCKLIQEGKLLTIGYRKPKLRNSKPIWIDAAHWLNVGSGHNFATNIDWTASELTVGSFAFQDVRVVATPEFEIAEHRNTKAKRRKPGAPTFEFEIQTAFRTLVAEGKIDFTTSLRANLDVIQKRAGHLIDPTRHHSKIRGIKYDAVLKAIGEEFKREKANRASG